MPQPWIVDLVERAKSLATERQKLINFGNTIKEEVSGELVTILSPDNEFDSFLMALCVLYSEMEGKLKEEGMQLQNEISYLNEAGDTMLALQKTHILACLKMRVWTAEGIFWMSLRERSQLTWKTGFWIIGPGWTVYHDPNRTRRKKNSI